MLLFLKRVGNMKPANAGVVKLVDTLDSKSNVRKEVPVGVRPPVEKTL